MQANIIKKTRQKEQWLDFIQNQIGEIINGASLISLLAQITSAVINSHLGCIVALHHKGIWEKLFEISWQFLSTHKLGKQEVRQVSQKIQILYHYGYDIFLLLFKKQYPVFHSLAQKFNKQTTHTKYTGGLESQYEKTFNYMRKTLKEVLEFRMNVQKEKTRILSIQRLMNKASSFKPSSFYEEIFITFVRQQLEQYQRQEFNSASINNTTLCCRFHYVQNETISPIDTSYQTFISDREKEKLFTSQYYRDYFKKLAVGYLNGNGGVIVIGCDCDGKKITMKGVAMTESQRKLYRSLLTDTFSQVYPQLQDSSIETQQMEKVQVYNEAEDKVNQFISVDYLNLYDPSYLNYSRRAAEVLYIIRIKITPGHPFELYHYVNSKQTPEAIIRQGKKERMLSFHEFHDEHYRRAKCKKMKGKGYFGSCWLPHSFCRLWKPYKCIEYEEYQ